MNTRKGFPSRVNGRRICYPVTAGHAPTDPLHLLNLQLNAFNWWMVFGPTNIFGVEGTNSFDISLAGQIAVVNPREWSTTLLNGIPVFTNGKNELMFWDGNGANDALIVPGWPATTVCKFVVAFKFHLFALNIDGPSGQFDNLLMWSDAADPGALPLLWTPAAGNEAGSAIVADTPGPIITGAPLAQALMIYKGASSYAVEYAGQPPDNIFTVRCTNRSLGTLGPNCVRELGTKHLVVGNDDVVLTDSISTQSIADNRIKLFLANSIDETNGANAYVVRDLNRRETWVCVPESGNQFANIAHVWDESRDTWTTRDLQQARYGTVGYVTDTSVNNTWNADGNAWDSDASAWNEGSTGAVTHVVTGESSVMYVEDTVDAVSLTAFITKEDLPFDDDSAVKLTDRVTIRGSGTGFGNLEFRLGARDSTDQPITWGVYVALMPEGTPYEVSGRYISISIRATGTLVWTIDRIQIEARLNGAF